MKVAYSISQLIISNAIKCASKAKQLKQMKERETPLTIYRGLKSQAWRKAETIKKDHALGLSVSVDRILEFRRQFARVVTKMWMDEGVVIPPTVKQQIFVTCSTDNCDIAGDLSIIVQYSLSQLM